MEKQIIITVGREFGSGGHYIAENIAKELGIQLYDKALLEQIAMKVGYTHDDMERYDEKPRNPFLSRRVREYSNSIEENIANNVFDFIRSKAEEGESFVVVGRCAEYVLRDNENTLKVFVRSNEKDKIERVSRIYKIGKNKALEMMKKNDKQRKMYHNYYSDIKWGDCRGYDICLNSGLLGVEKSINMVLEIAAMMKYKEEL